MNVLHALHALLGGGQQAAQHPIIDRMPMKQAMPEMQYAQPMPPPAINGQVDPASQALYQQALASSQRHTSPLHTLIHGGSPQGYGGYMGPDYDGAVANSQQLAQPYNPQAGFGQQVQGIGSMPVNVQNGGGVSDISLQGANPRYSRGNITF